VTPEALIVGRVGLDLYPEQARRRLEDVETYRQYAGGFAANIATGLARLGVTPAVVSAVGADGHGRFIRRFLETEGVDCTWLGVNSELPTALAFCELWPPDLFPITYHRTPTCPDWEITPDDIDLGVATRVPLVYLSGTALAREPSRRVVLAVARARTPGSGHTIFDLDWRPALWPDAQEFPVHAARLAPLATTILGGDAEWAASGLDPAAPSDTVCVVKHGPDGATVHSPNGPVRHQPACPVEVVNGLGAGDAFAAGWGYALLRGGDPPSVAAANGAITASRHSCSTAMATEAELRHFLATGRLDAAHEVAPR
jgi:5-dehydro-2-deoxygluconokinase